MTQLTRDSDRISCRTEADRLACLRDLPTTYGEMALTLVANGWPVVPLVADSKVPNRREWQHRTALSPTDLRRMVEQELQWRGPADRRGSAVGIVVPPTVLAIDSDSLDRLVQDAVWQMMINTFGQPDMVRVGRAPKWMAFFAATPGIRSSKLPGIESFCGSGQIAAFGVHDTTGKPYAWSERSPLNTRPHELCTRVLPRSVEHFIERLVVAGILKPTSCRTPNTTDVNNRSVTAPMPYEATERLHQLFAKYDNLVRPAIRELVTEIGKAGHGRHNAIVAIAGRLVLQRWTDQQAIDFLVPLVNEAFADGDWTQEIDAALRHARGREAARFAGMKTASWPSARVGAVR